jgi:hypothetical protein
MLTPTSIANLNLVEDLRLSFEADIITITTPVGPAATARAYMDLVVKELCLDILKRDGS